MNKYKSRTEIVEAVQIDNENIEDVTAWCGGSMPAGWSLYPYIEIRIKRGKYITGSVGEWMIKDENGNFSTCKSEEFNDRYEAINA